MHSQALQDAKKEESIKPLMEETHGILFFPMVSIDMKSIKFKDALTGFAFGTGSVYSKTTDGGNNWYEHPIGLAASGSITMLLSHQNGTIHAAGTYGAMIRSTDQGANFTTAPFVTEHYISNIRFVNNTTGYAVAGYDQGDILKNHGCRQYLDFAGKYIYAFDLWNFIQECRNRIPCR
jgi:hypothetical protein